MNNFLLKFWHEYTLPLTHWSNLSMEADAYRFSYSMITNPVLVLWNRASLSKYMLIRYIL